MKKILVLFVVLIISQMMAAQSLIGTWKGHYTDGTSVTYLFSQPNRMKKVNKKDMKHDAAGSFQLSITYSGCYTRSENNVLYIRLEKASVNVGDIKFNSNLSQEERNQLSAAAYKTANFYTQAINSQLPGNDTIEIKSMTANEMVLITSNGVEERLKRVAYK